MGILRNGWKMALVISGIFWGILKMYEEVL